MENNQIKRSKTEDAHDENKHVINNLMEGFFYKENKANQELVNVYSKTLAIVEDRADRLYRHGTGMARTIEQLEIALMGARQEVEQLRLKRNRDGAKITAQQFQLSYVHSVCISHPENESMQELQRDLEYKQQNDNQYIEAYHADTETEDELSEEELQEIIDLTSDDEEEVPNRMVETLNIHWPRGPI